MSGKRHCCARLDQSTHKIRMVWFDNALLEHRIFIFTDFWVNWNPEWFPYTKSLYMEVSLRGKYG